MKKKKGKKFMKEASKNLLNTKKGKKGGAAQPEMQQPLMQGYPAPQGMMTGPNGQPMMMMPGPNG